MSEWRYLLSDHAIEFILTCSSKERARLFAIIRRLAFDPYVASEFVLRDDRGRDVSFITREGFSVGFWLDHFVNEVRVVDIDRA